MGVIYIGNRDDKFPLSRRVQLLRRTPAKFGDIGGMPPPPPPARPPNPGSEIQDAGRIYTGAGNRVEGIATGLLLLLSPA
jgi:hypothetical protein